MKQGFYSFHFHLARANYRFKEIPIRRYCQVLLIYILLQICDPESIRIIFIRRKYHRFRILLF